MFVKQLTEVELNEYERQLQGVSDSVKQLAANDELTREAVQQFVDATTDLQTLVQAQIAGFHSEPVEPTPPDPD